MAARVACRIRIEALWLSVAPLDMRAGMDTLLARVVLPGVNYLGRSTSIILAGGSEA